jgi:hypothetical protein
LLIAELERLFAGGPQIVRAGVGVGQSDLQKSSLTR